MDTDVQFDYATHTYTVDGLVVPHVTGALDPLMDWSKVPTDVLEFARERGQAVHKATELYDQDDLDMDSLDERLCPYVEAWIRFRDDTGFIVHTIEQRVYSSRYRYAGMLDRAGELFKDEAILDIKARYNLGPETGLQIAAYAEAWRTDRRKKLPRRWGLQLAPTLNPPYRLLEYKERSDFSVFLSCLQILNWRTKHALT